MFELRENQLIEFRVEVLDDLHRHEGRQLHQPVVLIPRNLDHLERRGPVQRVPGELGLDVPVELAPRERGDPVALVQLGDLQELVDRGDDPSND